MAYRQWFSLAGADGPAEVSGGYAGLEGPSALAWGGWWRMGLGHRRHLSPRGNTDAQGLSTDVLSRYRGGRGCVMPGGGC